MSILKLIKKVRSYNNKADAKLIKKAYTFAYNAHKGKKRASGEDYITHPLHVALLLADFHLDEKAISAALLHDVVEDTSITLDKLRKEFGDEIASLVDGVTELSRIKRNKETFDSENIIKMLMASINDVRIILIKLADRLHNMRTLKYLEKERQEKIAKSTLEIYAPIAYRLGLYNVKSELEDLAFKSLNPRAYRKVQRTLRDYEKEREKILSTLKDKLEKELEKINIKAKLQGRVKHLYSIYKKLERKKIELKDITDLIALRVIVKNVKECYEVLGIVHNLWKPVPGRLKDMIAIPKSNLYQSIHTTLIAETGHQFEIQIRTEDMHKINEEGIAAHWKYKGLGGDKSFDKKLSWLKEITEWKRSENPNELIENIKVDLFGYELYVFTPKGKVITLPRGSSVLDFAYGVHSDIGDHSIGAKVNGKFVGLKNELKNGDIVEILTSKKQNPSREWLKYVKTLKARDKIKRAVKLKGDLPMPHLLKKEDKKEEIFGSLLKVKNAMQKEIRLAKCCNPLPGDTIVGLNVKKGVAIHKKNCDKIKLEKNFLDAEWLDKFDNLIVIEVLCGDRVGLMADLMNTISRRGINVDKAKAKIIDENIAQCLFTIRFKQLKELSDLLNAIKKVKSVKRISLGF